MPKKKADPKDTPEAQHKRFKELAKEVGAKDDKAFEKAFGKVVPTRQPPKKG
ncbi:MAG: hypothetical protein ACK4X1_01220 [Terricaulis sp.]